jgi:hypothetical protein
MRQGKQRRCLVGGLAGDLWTAAPDVDSSAADVGTVC